MICISFGCGSDKPTKPTPEEKFELRIAVVDSSGAPVEGLQISAWNLIQKTEIRFNTIQSHPSQPSAVADLPGDVDCDGVAYARGDAALYFPYLMIGDSILDARGIRDCFLSNGDVVRETPGVTTADYYQVLRIYEGMPVKSDHETYSLTYTYDVVTGTISLDDDLRDQGIKLAAMRVISGPHQPRYNSKVADDCLSIDYWTRDSVTTVLAFVWPSLASPCYDFIEDQSFGVAGGIALIEGCTEFGDPVVFERRARDVYTTIVGPQPSDSVITIQLPFISYPYSLVTRDLHENMIDSIYGITPDPSTHEVREMRPNDGKPGVYLFDLLAQETPELLGKGRNMAAIWSDDPQRNVIGHTDAAGLITCSNDLLFPSLLVDYSLMGWIRHPEIPEIAIGYDKVNYLDSIHVVVRDTLTNVTVEGTYPLTPRKNNITITWP
jgi:hypothetical protein